MAVGWQIPRAHRQRLAPTAAVLVAAMLAVLAVLAIIALTDYRPLTPVSGDAGSYRVGGTSTGGQTAPTAAAVVTAETSAQAATGRAEASSEHSVTMSDGSGGLPAGVVVTNLGAATADVGGNVAVGSDQPDGSSASVTTGDATAVGNRSSTGVDP